MHNTDTEFTTWMHSAQRGCRVHDTDKNVPVSTVLIGLKLEIVQMAIESQVNLALMCSNSAASHKWGGVGREKPDSRTHAQDSTAQRSETTRETRSAYLGVAGFNQGGGV